MPTLTFYPQTYSVRKMESSKGDYDSMYERTTSYTYITDGIYTSYLTAIRFDNINLPSNVIINSVYVYAMPTGLIYGTYDLAYGAGTGKSLDFEQGSSTRVISAQGTFLTTNKLSYSTSISAPAGFSDNEVYLSTNVTTVFNSIYGVENTLHPYRFLVLRETSDSAAIYNSGVTGKKPYMVVNYTIPNATPTIPSSISVPSLKGGTASTISWGASTDADGDTINYYVERSINGGAYALVRSGGTTLTFSQTPLSTWNTVAYRVRAYDGKVYSGYRTSSTVTVTHNTAPTIPSSITVPELKSGTSSTISWGASTDADGDTINYYVERSINGGAYTSVYTGSSRSKSETPLSTWNTVTYRVRAYDGTAYSGYRTSSTVTVKHFPEMGIRVSGTMKTSTDGWVRVDGALRKIGGIWTRVNGILKEV